MWAVKVVITGFVSAEPQPGVVACALVDAHGRTWVFHEKTAIVSDAALDASSAYPLPGVIACELLSRGPEGIATIDTARPWGVGALDGTTRFDIDTALLLPLEPSPA